MHFEMLRTGWTG